MGPDLVADPPYLIGGLALGGAVFCVWVGPRLLRRAYYAVRRAHWRGRLGGH